EMSLRTAAEMDAIERAGAAVALALDAASAAVCAGATTAALDRAARAALEAAGAEPTFVGYPNPNGGPAFPAAACVSVANEAVDGIPGARVLRAGELVKIDVGALDGVHLGRRAQRHLAVPEGTGGRGAVGDGEGGHGQLTLLMRAPRGSAPCPRKPA
ncbi:MAG: M24 family metallopeptidase, partial [Phycisphaerales bacterium]